MRLYRQMPGATLLVSGGSVFGYGSDADAMQALAIGLGVNPADIVLDMESPDTETQAKLIRTMVGNERVVLVTSASHMPRSVGLFERAGVGVLPAPTHYLVQDNAGFSPTYSLRTKAFWKHSESSMRSWACYGDGYVGNNSQGLCDFFPIVWPLFGVI